MPEKKPLAVLWTEQALKNAASIKAYLRESFSDKEILRFYSLLSTFEEAVSFFPELYPQTRTKTKMRRAVLSKELSSFYRVSNNQIEVLAILDNRCDLSKWLEHYEKNKIQ